MGTTWYGLHCCEPIASILIDHSTDYKFDLMYSKRAFVHWYVGEGMEEVCPVLYVRRLEFVYSLLLG